MIDKELKGWDVKNLNGDFIGVLSGKWFKFMGSYIYEVIMEKGQLFIHQERPIAKDRLKEVIYEYPRIS